MKTVKEILSSVETKKHDHKSYNFTQLEDDALKTFFDLSQEYDNIDDFYNLCVAIPKSFFNLNARLYLYNPKINDTILVSETEKNKIQLCEALPFNVKTSSQPYSINGSFVLPIRGKEYMLDELPFDIKNNVLGLLEVYPCDDIDERQEFFFEKYANRIGFNIHNRYFRQKNIEHIGFIRTLVADIEHNIIAPNIVYKLFLRRLKGKIKKSMEIEKLLTKQLKMKTCDKDCIEKLLEELTDVNHGLNEEFENIEKHYKNTTLFLETLLRRSHFDEGQLTLRTKKCNIKKDVVQPQLERFSARFKEMGITIDDRLSGIPDEDTIIVIDVGLIAQVYANLFSNSLKYTREITTNKGKKKKYISYGRDITKNYFGKGKDGIKYNVYTTGPHIAPEEREKIFEEGYRGSNTVNRPGTGQGLSFIKNAVKIHGGTVGYEATRYGNNFYFILPA